MSELTWRLRSIRPASGSRAWDLLWLWAAALGGAAVVGYGLTVSVQAACAFVLVVAILALHQHDRRWGIGALFALWFLAPGLRRVLGLVTGYVDSDPLSLTPFLATGAVAALELVRVPVPVRVRRIMLMAAAGFALGLPVGLLQAPQAALYAFVAYLAGIAGAALAVAEPSSAQASILRRVLLFGVLPLAAYAVLQRVVPLPSWDQRWLDSTDFETVGAPGGEEVRVFSTLNSPGTLGPILGLSVLCYLTVGRVRASTVVAVGVVVVALSLTFVRSAWLALAVAGIAHVVASQGRSARPVLGAGAVVVAATLALAPVSPAARDVLNRFNTFGNLGEDTSSTERQATFTSTFPRAMTLPLGRGLGSAGEPSKLSGDQSLRAPDNGYLSLAYQLGPVGFLLVMAALVLIVQAAWRGAQARAPGQDLRLLLFAMLIFMLVVLTSGDAFYGSQAVILWFIGGQALAYDELRRRRLDEASRRPVTASA